MKLKDLKDTYERHPYHNKCVVCHNETTLYTQADRNPEYYTTIYIECPHCDTDELIEFKLPVN